MCPLQKKMMDKAFMSQVRFLSSLPFLLGGKPRLLLLLLGTMLLPATASSCFLLSAAGRWPRLTCAAPQKEIGWVDGYHRQVWEALSPRLAGQEEELAWLQQATAPL